MEERILEILSKWKIKDTLSGVSIDIINADDDNLICIAAETATLFREFTAELQKRLDLQIEINDRLLLTLREAKKQK